MLRYFNREDLENLLRSTLSCTVISSKDREKAVLWFGSGPPCLHCLWLPVNQNTNLTADRIPPIPALCLLTYCDNNLSQLFIWFFFLFCDPSSGTVSVYLSDYGFLFPSLFFFKQLMFGEAGHLYTHIHIRPPLLCDFSIYSPCAGNNRWLQTTCSGTYTHWCFPFCFDSFIGVWGSLETQWPWESCLPIRW